MDVASAKQYTDIVEQLQNVPGAASDRKRKLGPNDLNDYWMTDRAAPQCMNCKRKFSLTLRRSASPCRCLTSSHIVGITAGSAEQYFVTTVRLIALKLHIVWPKYESVSAATAMYEVV